MTDIFDNKIICNKCNIQMMPNMVTKRGIRLRSVECPHCHDQIIHPADEHKFQDFNQLKQKTYAVKLRVVGNSHAVSIPKEIIDFINEMNKDMSSQMNDMVRLCLEDFGKISLSFNDEFHNQEEQWQNQIHRNKQN